MLLIKLLDMLCCNLFLFILVLSWLTVCRIADNLIAANRLGNSIPSYLSDIILCAFLRLSVPPSAEDSTSSGLFSIMRQAVYMCRQTAQKRGSAPPMTRFSRRSSCTRSRLDTFVSRRSLTAIAVRRLPFNMVSPSTKKIRSFGSIFVLAYFTGCLRVSLVFVYNCISSQYFCKNLCLNLSKTLDLSLLLH